MKHAWSVGDLSSPPMDIANCRGCNRAMLLRAASADGTLCSSDTLNSCPVHVHGLHVLCTAFSWQRAPCLKLSTQPLHYGTSLSLSAKGAGRGPECLPRQGSRDLQELSTFFGRDFIIFLDRMLRDDDFCAAADGKFFWEHVAHRSQGRNALPSSSELSYLQRGRRD